MTLMMLLKKSLSNFIVKVLIFDLSINFYMYNKALLRSYVKSILKRD